MNVVFVITSSEDNAKGGHFRSCLTIAKSLRRKGVNIRILNVGLVLSPIFRQCDVVVDFIDIKAYSWPYKFYSFYKNIKDRTKETKVLAFDFFSFFLVRTVCFFTKHPFGYFRCGGPNLRYFPYSKWVFCFSLESYSCFVGRFPKSIVYLFPNRVEKLTSHSNGKLRRILNNKYPIILRVGRLVTNYADINKTCLNLSRFLHSMNIPHNLVFIGYPENYHSNYFLNFKAECDLNLNATLLTTPEFTANAALFLSEADLVVGTGRGAMEAIVEKRIVAVFSKSHNIPVLLQSPEIFNSSLDFNFSLRNDLSFVNSELNRVSMVELFLNRSYSYEVLSFLNDRRKLFDVDEVAGEYMNAFYEMTYDDESHFVDGLKHFLKMFLFKAISLR
ncbi:MAG: hypothetical protein K9I82_17325 [Chitinophagaceae bacterium]|nr:hypothetical protein [Chitinophagaceae bacterium]